MAWPDIQILHLEGGLEGPERPRATLSGLTAFAEHCKRLCNLTIAVDATVIPILKPGPKISSKSLTKLHVLSSPIAQPKQVATFLSDLFPNLLFISNSYTESRIHIYLAEAEEDQARMWLEVEVELMTVFASGCSREGSIGT
jgi:hypothetical protein